VDFSTIFLLVVTVLFLYSTGGSWMLQIVSYPGYHLVGDSEFVSFHVDAGKRLMRVFVIPAVVACIASLALVLLKPNTLPLLPTLIVAACGLTILVTTVVLEVPKHNALDRSGKSTALIDGLVRDNLPRALAWTLGSGVLVWQLVSALRA
jgi:hypothetical protein